MEQAIDQWAAWAIETVEAWPDDLSLAEPDLDVLATMADHDDALVARAMSRKAV